jgi:hypothetical protein
MMVVVVVLTAAALLVGCAVVNTSQGPSKKEDARRMQEDSHVRFDLGQGNVQQTKQNRRENKWSFTKRGPYVLRKKTGRYCLESWKFIPEFLIHHIPQKLCHDENVFVVVSGNTSSQFTELPLPVVRSVKSVKKKALHGLRAHLQWVTEPEPRFAVMNRKSVP